MKMNHADFLNGINLFFERADVLIICQRWILWSPSFNVKINFRSDCDDVTFHLK